MEMQSPYDQLSPTITPANPMNAPNLRNNGNSKATGRSSPALLHHRAPTRAATFGGDLTGPGLRRRSSLMAESVDEARQSIRSSTDDLLLPRAKSSVWEMQEEPSHWHSLPLGLALLPAVGGLLFTNGSAIITDVTLLVLAAVFLNWSVRLPWHWYRSAQSIQIQDPNSLESFHRNDTIIEEESEDEEGRMKSPSSDRRSRSPPKSRIKSSHTQENAVNELRVHELLALFACFVSPCVGAWMLHAIRSQLSRPSEGLVSNYNLTIFLLGSELRPLSHLIKMVQSRTLYLQRIVNNNPFETETVDMDKVMDMSKRLDELEIHVANKSAVVSSDTSVVATKTAEVSSEVRKNLQPELDALNRAVRRYEKRATLLTMQTESRLQDLESRMADAITLAAAAERGNSSRKGSAAILLDWACAAVVVPAQVAWTAMSLPARTAAWALGVTQQHFGAKVRTEMRTTGRTGSGSDRSRNSRAQARGSKKMF